MLELSLYPAKAYMEKMLAEGVLFLRNLNTNPGATDSLSAALARENLVKALSTPLKIPV